MYALPIPGGTPRLVVDTPISIEDQTHLSPDGRWLAFNSDESGVWGVYVARRFLVLQTSSRSR